MDFSAFWRIVSPQDRCFNKRTIEREKIRCTRMSFQKPRHSSIEGWRNGYRTEWKWYFEKRRESSSAKWAKGKVQTKGKGGRVRQAPARQRAKVTLSKQILIQGRFNENFYVWIGPRKRTIAFPISSVAHRRVTHRGYRKPRTKFSGNSARNILHGFFRVWRSSIATDSWFPELTPEICFLLLKAFHPPDSFGGQHILISFLPYHGGGSLFLVICVYLWHHYQVRCGQ